MLSNYVKYLEFLDGKLDKFFESQKPYIFCEKGCGRCCQNAQFPYSQLEASHLFNGAVQLDADTQAIIEKNIKETLAKREKSEDKKHFKYDCPFLINNVCSVYQNRGIVCRTFGLMTATEDDKVKAPFCFDYGLNYSNVMNEAGTNVSPEKFKALGLKEEPLAFNIDYKYLTNIEYEKKYNIIFGPQKPLIEWFLEE